MKTRIVLVSLCLISSLSFADDLTRDAAIGGAIGGALGGVIGAETGGREGAILGSGVGAAVGTTIATKGDRDDHHTSHPEVHVVESNSHPHIHHCPPGQRKKGRC